MRILIFLPTLPYCLSIMTLHKKRDHLQVKCYLPLLRACHSNLLLTRAIMLGLIMPMVSIYNSFMWLEYRDLACDNIVQFAVAMLEFPLKFSVNKKNKLRETHLKLNSFFNEQKLISFVRLLETF